MTHPHLDPRHRSWPFDATIERRAYVRRLLETYRGTPGVAGYVRRADRALAGRLFDRRVPLRLAETAIALAAVRRIYADPAAGPAAPVRSLHYFLGVVEELLREPPDPSYRLYLSFKLRHLELYGLKPPPT